MFYSKIVRETFLIFTTIQSIFLTSTFSEMLNTLLVLLNARCLIMFKIKDFQEKVFCFCVKLDGEGKALSASF